MGIDLDFENYGFLEYTQYIFGETGKGIVINKNNIKILKQLKSCVEKSNATKQILIPLGLDMAEENTSHANILILNLRDYTIKRYNPWGVNQELSSDKYSFANKKIVADISSALPIPELLTLKSTRKTSSVLQGSTSSRLSNLLAKQMVNRVVDNVVQKVSQKIKINNGK
jgi:hypothetical protein